MATIVSCPNCHAEVTTDREACPHCGADLPNPNEVMDTLRAANAKLKAQVAEIEDSLKKENEDLTKKLAAKK